jgi:hypothetical protein
LRLEQILGASSARSILSCPAVPQTKNFSRKSWGFRVTRLGEFSPFGRLFSLDYFLKITEVAQLWHLLFYKKICINSANTLVWLCTFLAIFSQTHLVTMDKICGQIRKHSS